MRGRTRPHLLAPATGPTIDRWAIVNPLSGELAPLSWPASPRSPGRLLDEFGRTLDEEPDHALGQRPDRRQGTAEEVALP
ncbi:hypothetical protein [Nocardia sp. alder85J]|uniref:hypothetical protein n=1 Tax=Nocardia sp. alder85J TaxID=2862949 RepID=UPI001CD3DA76|nr:hypothetical protein [Nocardia sp. alder85J]MCX4096401.1 hypothetical protein [Nocardia sp. alder85J]